MTLGGQRNGREFGDQIIRRPFVEALVVGDRAGVTQQEGVTVGRLGDAVRADHSAGAGDVFHDHLLTENLTETRCEDAAERVERPSSRERDYHGDWPRRPVLRERRARAEDGRRR